MKSVKEEEIMYTDLMISKKTNEIAAKRIGQKIEEMVKMLPEQSDADFISNLHDLCILNRMADSHDG